MVFVLACKNWLTSPQPIDLKAKQYIRYINNQNIENIRLIQGGFYIRKTKKGRLLLSRNYIKFWTASPQSIIFRKLTNDEKIKSAMYELLKKEEQFGVKNYETYEKFGEKIYTIKKNVKKNIKNLKSNGKKIIGYGSPAKPLLH